MEELNMNSPLSEAEARALIAAMEPILGITVTSAQMPGVIANLQTAATMFEVVNSNVESHESAAVFTPVEPTR